MNKLDKFRACLLGGAIGDALGYPIEFMSLKEIKLKYGNSGLTDLIADKTSKRALISDDTQMTIFTAEGIIWASRRMSDRGIGSFGVSGTYQSYLRWLYTQTDKIENDYWLEKTPYEKEDKDGIFVLDVKELYASRAPGLTCLSALESGKMGSIEEPINDSKGCGGIMRVAPVGLLLHEVPKGAFEVGCELAAITHGHPTGYLSAGAFAMIIAELVNNKSLIESIRSTIKTLIEYKDHEETLEAINKAIELSKSNTPSEEAISQLGEGWVAEEALAIGLYCALKEDDYKKAVIASVNHDGDSDSTGSICGNIMGAKLGMNSIPQKWLETLELKDYIEKLADKLFDTYRLKDIDY